jgi:hypothetical protein
VGNENSIGLVRKAVWFAISKTTTATTTSIHVVLFECVVKTFVIGSQGHATWSECRKCGGGRRFGSEKICKSP